MGEGSRDLRGTLPNHLHRLPFPIDSLKSARWWVALLRSARPEASVAGARDQIRPTMARDGAVPGTLELEATGRGGTCRSGGGGRSAVADGTRSPVALARPQVLNELPVRADERPAELLVTSAQTTAERARTVAVLRGIQDRHRLAASAQRKRLKPARRLGDRRTRDATRLCLAVFVGIELRYAISRVQRGLAVTGGSLSAGCAKRNRQVCVAPDRLESVLLEVSVARRGFERA